MKVALVHDYLIQDGGAERVLLALHQHFPDAPIYTLFVDHTHLHPELQTARIVPSHLQRYLFHPRLYQLFLPLMPEAMERFDLSEYDVVIASSSSFAKGAIIRPDGHFVCYLHTPTRFLWEERTRYLESLGFGSWLRRPLKQFLHRLRLWDRLAAERPDLLITNSKTSQHRIRRYYQKESTILHPPIDLTQLPFNPQPGRFWLTGGRLLPYKRFEISIGAANALQAPLKLFGVGPDEKRLRALAGPTVEFLGHVDEPTKHALYQQSFGFLHPQIEDFGITALEAMAHGKPVLAFNQGGAQETVIDQKTGIFFERSDVPSLVQAMQQRTTLSFDPQALRAHVEPFDLPHFFERFDALLASHLHASPH